MDPHLRCDRLHPQPLDCCVERATVGRPSFSNSSGGATSLQLDREVADLQAGPWRLVPVQAQGHQLEHLLKDDVTLRNDEEN